LKKPGPPPRRPEEDQFPIPQLPPLPNVFSEDRAKAPAIVAPEDSMEADRDEKGAKRTNHHNEAQYTAKGKARSDGGRWGRSGVHERLQLLERVWAGSDQNFVGANN
jgi:hypothetical protein